MVYKTAFNTTDSPVVVDVEGHVIGGREWGTIETTEDAAKAALDDGRIVIVDTPSDAGDLDKVAQAALKHTEEMASTKTSRAKRGATEEG